MNEGNKAWAEMRKKWYVLEMNRHRDHVKPETKLRLTREFEDSVLEYARLITARRNSG